MKYISDSYGEYCRFDAFCKTVLRNEAKTYLRDLCRQRKREIEFSALSQYEMDKLCTVDEYPSDSVVFTAFGCNLIIPGLATPDRRLRRTVIFTTCISGTSWWPTPLPVCRNGRKVF